MTESADRHDRFPGLRRRGFLAAAGGAASAQARVRQATPPSVGVLAITALPARACTSIAWTSTDMG